MGEKVLVFYVKGSGKKPYRVAFWKEEGSRDIHSGCGCPAGRRMQYCKHRFQLIEGDLTNLHEDTENAEENLKILYEWLSDSDIGDFFNEFIMAKTGEKIFNLSNNTKFLYNENLVHYKYSHMKEDFKFDYKELTGDEFEKFLASNLILIENTKIYNLFSPENKNYFGSFKIDNIENYKFKKLAPKLFSTSEYLKNCYDLYKQINIETYNERMKEIMK